MPRPTTQRGNVNVFFPIIRKKLEDNPVPTTTGTMPTPSWVTLETRGTNLYAEWTRVPGKSHYEIYYNSAPNSTGAVLYKTNLENNSGLFPISRGVSSELVLNGGFESGMTNWQTDGLGLSTTASDQYHSGSRSLKLYSTGLETVVYSAQFNATANKSYQTSFWYKRTAGSGLGLWADVDWINSDGVHTSTSTITNGTASAWTQVTCSSTTASDAQYGAVYFYLLEDATIYVDDVSLVGEVTFQPSDYYYAVRSVQADGTTSPFSAWLKPINATANVGVNSLEIDYANERIQSSNFVTGASGAQISSSGIDGNINFTGLGLGSGAKVLGTKAGSGLRAEFKSGSVSAAATSITDLTLTWDNTFSSITTAVASLRKSSVTYNVFWLVKSYSASNIVVSIDNETAGALTYYVDAIGFGS